MLGCALSFSSLSGALSCVNTTYTYNGNTYPSGEQHDPFNCLRPSARQWTATLTLTLTLLLYFSLLLCCLFIAAGCGYLQPNYCSYACQLSSLSSQNGATHIIVVTLTGDVNYRTVASPSGTGVISILGGGGGPIQAALKPGPVGVSPLAVAIQPLTPTIGVETSINGDYTRTYARWGEAILFNGVATTPATVALGPTGTFTLTDAANTPAFTTCVPSSPTGKYKTDR